MITLSCIWDPPPPSPLPPSEWGCSQERSLRKKLSVNYFYTRNEGSHLTLYIVRILLLGSNFLLEAWSVPPLLTLEGGLSGSVLGAQFEYLFANVCLRLCLEMAPSAKATAPKGSVWWIWVFCCFRSTCHDSRFLLVPSLWMSTHLFISFSPIWYKLQMRQHRYREVKWLSWHHTA